MTLRPLIAGLVAALLGCAPGSNEAAAQGPAPRSPTPEPIEGVIESEVIARGLDHPWSVALLPDGRFLVTERPGRIRIVEANGTVGAALSGMPEVMARGQGGLLDLALNPDFAQNQVFYFSFSEPGGSGTAGTAVARAQLGAGGVEGVEVIYRQDPKVQSNGHYGSRVVLRPDGTLFVTQGDRMNQRPLVQDLSTGIGKIMRINADGSAPDDNPFVQQQGAQPEIWSYGHRNVQAAALDPVTGQLWTVEHGARGGDELNHPEAGKNYGWPVITYGIDYSGARIGEGTSKEGMEQPVYYWDPVIAPSGMAFYNADVFAGWKGSILIGSLGTGSLVRLTMADGKVTSEERYEVLGGQRVRDVQVGPDGLIYLVTDEDDGALVRVKPAG